MTAVFLPVGPILSGKATDSDIGAKIGKIWGTPGSSKCKFQTPYDFFSKPRRFRVDIPLQTLNAVKKYASNFSNKSKSFGSKF